MIFTQLLSPVIYIIYIVGLLYCASLLAGKIRGRIGGEQEKTSQNKEREWQGNVN